MAFKKSLTKLDGSTINELAELRIKLRLEPVPTKIWRGLLSEDERETLGGGKVPPPRLTESYAKLRGHTPARALVELAKSVSLLDEAEYRRLRAAIDEPVEPPRTVPRWDAASGKLYFRGEIVRTVTRRGTNMRLILDAFDDAGWPLWIYNPLPGGADSGKLRQTLYDLRKTLKAINLIPDGTATGILWQESQRLRRTRAFGSNSARR
jgi:hypothetical protein